ncbi:hypothetical protein [Helicobacter cappadocius]|uniref:Uncharacterized protein n=1 Tax=Helicobacter cappadocius TaxID=3063998 RepID=A0AA90PU96_9HELI|nr:MULTISPECIES: hypothetical protein [unclassified Helicobacter]MDO7252797.1 hypothetical protein [Helicobacter sp. faydin-H75]MDP2538840.1 hypothetical protein [Helicobacter sp. faydin-H76]
MSALFGIFLVLFLALLILYFVLRDFGVFTRKQKIICIAGLVILGIFIMIYSYFQSRSDKNDMILQATFLRGGSLDCDDVIVNKENFNLVTGTLSFIGKKNGPMNNIIISLDKCRIVPQDNGDEESNSRTLEEELQRD